MERNNSHPALDRAEFAAAWECLGGSDLSAFDALEELYGEPHRAYHTAEHIAECMGWLNQVRDLTHRPDELAVAIFFHDAIYEPGAANNEAASASLFRRLASGAGIGAESIDRVAALIESTALDAEARGDAALLADIDLAILGSSPARYLRYEDSIRREYAAVPDGAFRAGRACLLRRFLERLEIYRTPYFATRLEAQARSNLSAMLDTLESEGGA